MIQGMKRQSGISKMKSINMGEQYFKGVLAGYLGAIFVCGPITEWQILETLREQATKVERISSKKTFRIIVKRQ